MGASPAMVLLFSYGTLQDRQVQLDTFSRELHGREDVLPAYRRTQVPIRDPEVRAATGESHYFNVEPSSDPEDSVAGVVFEITEAELAAADRYEEDADYRRFLVTLRSGTRAWVYRVP